MYKCKNCGTETDGNFCPNCGSAIDKSSSELTQSEAAAASTVAEQAVNDSVASTPVAQSVNAAVQTAEQQTEPNADFKTVALLTGSNVKRRYLRVGRCKILTLFGMLAMITALVLAVIGSTISSADVSSKAYLAGTWTQIEGLYLKTYELYTVTPEHYNTVIILVGMSSFVFAAGFVVWAIRKMLVYPEAARLLNKDPNTRVLYYEGLTPDQKKTVDAQCNTDKTYSFINGLTMAASLIMIGCAVVYLINAIGLMAKYYDKFEWFIQKSIDSADTSGSTTKVMISYCSGAVVGFLLVLLVYEVALVVARKRLNAKVSIQLSNCKF